MQELKVSIKSSKSWRKLIKRIGGIFGLRKRLNENLRQTYYESGRECGEALDPVLKRNLAYRLENIVLIEDSCSISRQYQAIESVIPRIPTLLAIKSTPLSSPVPSPKPDSSISPKSRPCSLSRSCSDASSIYGEVFTHGRAVDHPVPPFVASVPTTGSVVPIPAGIPEGTVSLTMEEAENGNMDKIG